MQLLEAIRTRRSIRRFKQIPVPDSTLDQLVDAARFAPSGGNMQHLRYLIVRTPEMVKQVFEHTAWGAHVRPARNPVWGKDAPLAFIAVFTSAESARHVHADAGAAVQNILLRARDLGLGTCWIGAFKPEKVAPIVGLGQDSALHFLVAVGYPDEDPVQEDIGHDGHRKYYLDKDDRLHVPKLKLDAIRKFK